MASNVEPFGKSPEDEPIARVILTGGGLTAKILTYGATVQDLRLRGVDYPLVLGAPTVEPYFETMRNYGAMVGRYANRIAHGKFSLDGNDYQVPMNYIGKHSLHGGTVGTSLKVWQIRNVEDDRATLGLILADGEMGFPGEMDVEVEFSLLDDGVLQLEITANCDSPTPCSFAHHGYFVLDDSGGILDHEMMVDAEAYLPVDNELIPTGEIAPVAGTPFDFRMARKIGPISNLDHNFCLADGARAARPVATLHSPRSGLSLVVETTEPGLQIYDAARIDPAGLPGLDGRTYGPHAGIALETQSWPDAPNRPTFPAAILRPGKTCRHVVRYVFQSEG